MDFRAIEWQDNGAAAKDPCLTAKHKMMHRVAPCMDVSCEPHDLKIMEEHDEEDEDEDANKMCAVCKVAVSLKAHFHSWNMVLSDQRDIYIYIYIYII